MFVLITEGGEWATWAEWRVCNTQCGKGEIFRVRHCSAGYGKCKGKNHEIGECEVPCPPGNEFVHTLHYNLKNLKLAVIHICR